MTGFNGMCHGRKQDGVMFSDNGLQRETKRENEGKQDVQKTEGEPGRERKGLGMNSNVKFY